MLSIPFPPSCKDSQASTWVTSTGNLRLLRKTSTFEEEVAASLPECSTCLDSGWRSSFSVCMVCDGKAKPIKKLVLQTELTIKRESSTQFLMLRDGQSEGSITDDEASEKTVADPPLCKLCFADVANVVFPTCGHGGFCEDCTRRLASEKSTASCPFCRAPITAFLKIDPGHDVSKVNEVFKMQVCSWRR